MQSDSCAHLKAHDVTHVIGESALQPPVKHSVFADAIDVRIAGGSSGMSAGEERWKHGLRGGWGRRGGGEFDSDGCGAALE